MTRRQAICLAAALPMRAQSASFDEIRALAEKAYLFAYPLVIMEFTRRDCPPAHGCRTVPFAFRA